MSEINIKDLKIHNFPITYGELIGKYIIANEGNMGGSLFKVIGASPSYKFFQIINVTSGATDILMSTPDNKKYDFIDVRKECEIIEVFDKFVTNSMMEDKLKIYKASFFSNEESNFYDMIFLSRNDGTAITTSLNFRPGLDYSLYYVYRMELFEDSYPEQFIVYNTKER